jgi:two-component system sensor kinase FixL
MNKTFEPISSIDAGVLDAARISVQELDGTIRYWSGGMERLYGFAAEEALGRSVYALLDTVFPRAQETIVEHLKSTGSWDGELLNRKKDGTRIVVVSHLALTEHPGKPALVTETSNDISEHRRLADYLAAIVQSTEDAVIGLTVEGIINSWNKAAEDMFGFTAAEMIGQPILRLHPPDRKREAEVIRREVARGNSIAHYDTLRLRRDGSEIAISLTVSPIRASDGTTIGASNILRNISDRRSAEERFHRMQAELAHMGRLSEMGQMASALAHELNQPLTATSNYIAAARRFLSATKPSPEKLRDALEKASTQVLRAGEIIRRLRGFLSKTEPEMHTVAVERLIEDAAALAQIDAKFRSIDLQFDFHTRDSVAAVDRVQFQQVLLNLLRNAFEATAGRPVRAVVVSTQAKVGEIEISVSDSGPGLAPEVAANLFSPFITTKKNGMGVGLSICRTIIESLGGRIWHQSSALGGASFAFTVPLARD